MAALLLAMSELRDRRAAKASQINQACIPSHQQGSGEFATWKGQAATRKSRADEGGVKQNQAAEAPGLHAYVVNKNNKTLLRLSVAAPPHFPLGTRRALLPLFPDTDIPGLRFHSHAWGGYMRWVCARICAPGMSVRHVRGYVRLVCAQVCAQGMCVGYARRYGRLSLCPSTARLVRLYLPFSCSLRSHLHPFYYVWRRSAHTHANIAHMPAVGCTNSDDAWRGHGFLRAFRGT